MECQLKELQESMDRRTGNHDITEILLKIALNTIQAIYHTSQSRLLTSQRKKAMENRAGKGENAGNHFLLFPAFSTPSKRKIVILETFNLSSANGFNLVLSKNCCSNMIIYLINSLPNDKLLDWSKLKAFADNKINVT